MAKWSAAVATWTPVAVANTTNYTDAGYMAVQGGSTTQSVNVLELYMGGQASSSAPCIMIVARDSTVGATSLSGATLAALDPATAALAAPMVAFNTSTTKPQRSSTLHMLNLSFNANGGVVRWLAAPGEEIRILGNTASFGELSLSAFTGGTPGLVGSHIILEPA